MKMCRIGILGLIHDHIWGVAEEVLQHEHAELVAAADPHQGLLEKASQQFGCATYDNYAAMLDNEQLDAAYVFSDNAQSVGLAELAASRGLPILIEKPLAHNLDGARRVMAAIEQHNVRLMVNWPFCWWPPLQRAIGMANEGQLGRIWQVKYRAAHAGPREVGCSDYFCDWLYDAQRNGAGAYMDYCCYGAALACSLLGTPDDVTAVGGRFTKTDIDVEDNAILVMKYPRAIAVAESSWSQIGNLSSYVAMIYGTEGTLMAEPYDGRLFLATNENPDGVEVDVPQPPAELTGATSHFLHCLDSGQEFMPLASATVCAVAQTVLDAGLRSMDSSK